MLVTNIFSKVNYPNDANDIKHIIDEYDKRLEHKLELPISKKPNYLFYAFSIINLFYIIKCSEISIFVRGLYIIPLSCSTIYSFFLFVKVKKDNYKNKKRFYKLINFDVIHILIYIFSGIFMYETVIFTKWNDRNYFVAFAMLFLLSIISSIIARIGAPKKFIENYQNKRSKLFTSNSLIIPVVQLLVGISYFNKPYYLLLVASSIFLVITSGIMTYVLFIYNQYDKIQELKKEINYIPKEIKE